jgi:hypothetical protein
MKPVLEPPRRPDSPASSLALFERIERAFAWNWHFHPEIELTCILDGSGTRLVGDRSSPYGRHDLVLLGSGLPHNWMPDGKKARSKPDHAVVVQFLPSVMPTGLLSLPEFARIRNLMERATRGIYFPAATGKRFGEKLRNLLHENPLVQWTGIIRILGELAGEPGSLLAGEGYRHRRSFKLSSRIDTVLRHIESNCREEIPLAEMASMAGLTPGSREPAASTTWRTSTGASAAFSEWRLAITDDSGRDRMGKGGNQAARKRRGGRAKRAPKGRCAVAQEMGDGWRMPSNGCRVFSRVRRRALTKEALI